jgi:DNA-binding response OmpR family regulator
MPPARKILIVDPDPATARQLAPALRQRGYQVHGARDGSRALQIAILRFPELVLFDERTPIIDARTFVRILRTNPRTERIPVVLTGESVDPDKIRVGAFLKKPFNQDEVLARIEQIFRRVETARAVAGENADIEGNLAQIPLVDLLQILAMNKKSGRLAIEREGETTEVSLVEGRVVDARVGPVAGEKALFRLLTHRDGQFAFLPGANGTERRIERRLDELLLDGLRQADELGRILPSLPSAPDRIELAVAAADVPSGLHPVTAEVIELLHEPRLLGELFDHAGASDLEAARAVSVLIERGYARRRTGSPEESSPAQLLATHELHALRTRIGQGRSSGLQTIGKVVLTGGGPLSRRAALARLATLPGFVPEPESESGFGTVGRLTLSPEVRVDLCELPGERVFRPLWRPFASGALGALVLLPVEKGGELMTELASGLRLPVVVCGPSEAAIPPALQTAPGGSVFGGSDAAEALRALLAGAGSSRVGY